MDQWCVATHSGKTPAQGSAPACIVTHAQSALPCYRSFALRYVMHPLASCALSMCQLSCCMQGHPVCMCAWLRHSGLQGMQQSWSPGRGSSPRSWGPWAERRGQPSRRLDATRKARFGGNSASICLCSAMQVGVAGRSACSAPRQSLVTFHFKVSVPGVTEKMAYTSCKTLCGW